MLLTLIIGRAAALRRLLSPITFWRTGWTWWGAAVLVQPALLLGAAIAHNALGFQPQISPVPALSAASLLISIFFLLLATMGEEIGWRGLALPALEQHRSAFKASLVLGLAYSVWHVPYWLLQSTFTQFGIGYVVLNFVFAVSITFYVTWFYNHGRFSLLLPIACHISFNLFNVVWLPATASMASFGILIAAEVILAAVLVRHLEAHRIHRGRSLEHLPSSSPDP
jgi:membrane protease YdiL (CAAX protease family)